MRAQPVAEQQGHALIRGAGDSDVDFTSPAAVRAAPEPLASGPGHRRCRPARDRARRARGGTPPRAAGRRIARGRLEVGDAHLEVEHVLGGQPRDRRAADVVKTRAGASAPRSRAATAAARSGHAGSYGTTTARTRNPRAPLRPPARRSARRCPRRRPRLREPHARRSDFSSNTFLPVPRITGKTIRLTWSTRSLSISS